MKNPNRTHDALTPAGEWTPLNEVVAFINRNKGQITYDDRETIFETIKNLIAWHCMDEKQQRERPLSIVTTSNAKQMIYWNTGLTPTLRRELATIFDTLAIRAGRPRWTFPTDKRGHIVIKPYQCYV